MTTMDARWRTVRIGDPENPGVWVEVRVQWLCPVRTCRRPWAEPVFKLISYSDGNGEVYAKTRVHVWERNCRHVVLNRELIEMSRTMRR